MTYTLITRSVWIFRDMQNYYRKYLTFGQEFVCSIFTVSSCCPSLSRFKPWLNRTSRKRHKSTPYLRLKNSKRTWKCQKTQSIKLTKRVSNSRKPKRRNWRAETGNISHFLTSIVAKHQKNWRGTLLVKKKSKKVSQCQKKLNGGTLWDFSTSILSQNIKKGGTLWGFFSKNLTMPKKN